MFQSLFTKLKMSFWALVLLSCSLQAQTIQPTVTEPTPVKTKKSMAIGIQTGSNGLFGADFAINVVKSLNVRLGYNLLTANGVVKPDLSQFGLDFPEVNKVISMDAELDMSNTNLIFEYLPTKKQRLRLQLGAALFTKGTVGGTISTTATITKDQWEITPEEIGTLTVTGKPKNKIAPYFGLGLGRSIPVKRVGFSIDLGTYFTNSFNFETSGTQLLSDNQHNGPILSRNLSSYKWFPVANMRLSVRLN